MKLTKEQLKRIIKEELTKAIDEDMGQMLADLGIEAGDTAAERMQAKKNDSMEISNKIKELSVAINAALRADDANLAGSLFQEREALRRELEKLNGK